ncbi:MAG: hypothetical protein ACE5KT_06065, partial [Methanosarcinales archaeon]
MKKEDKIQVATTLLIITAIATAIIVGVYVLIKSKSLSLTIIAILLLIPLIFGVFAMALYLKKIQVHDTSIEVKKKHITEIANNYIAFTHTLSDFENTYNINVTEIKEDLNNRVKSDISKLGGRIIGESIEIDLHKIRNIPFSEINRMEYVMENIDTRYGAILYTKTIDKCQLYLNCLKQLKDNGYQHIDDKIALLSTNIDKKIETDITGLSLFMNEMINIFADALEICLKSAKEMVNISENLLNIDVLRFHTDIKAAEKSKEYGNYLVAAKILNRFILELKDILKPKFEDYKNNVLKLLDILNTITKEKDLEEKEVRTVHEIKEKVLLCTSPTQMIELINNYNSLKKVAISLIENVYKEIMDTQESI